MAKRHYDFWTKFSYSGYSEKDWKKDDPSPFSFFFQKVKFWGLIFQSGPRNRESTFWKTAAVKSEKVKFLPFCHRTLRSDWSTRRNWTNSFYFLHRKRSSKFMSYYLTIAVSICAWFLKCQLGSLLQTWNKIDFESNLIFFRVWTWFLLPM